MTILKRNFLHRARAGLFKKWDFLYYKSIESLSTRLNNFNNFIQENHLESIQEITYRHLLAFLADYRRPSIHVKKARVWPLRQFFHFLKLNGNGGSGQAILLIFNGYRSKNRCFQALYHPFRPQNGHHRVQMALGADSLPRFF